MIGFQIATQFHLEMRFCTKNVDFATGSPPNFEDAALGHFQKKSNYDSLNVLNRCRCYYFSLENPTFKMFMKYTPCLGHPTEVVFFRC